MEIKFKRTELAELFSVILNTTVSSEDITVEDNPAGVTVSQDFFELTIAGVPFTSITQLNSLMMCSSDPEVIKVDPEEPAAENVPDVEETDLLTMDDLRQQNAELANRRRDGLLSGAIDPGNIPTGESLVNTAERQLGPNETYSPPSLDE